jgi:NADPH:quinone reductase-like Zn-dependent oxidoreductase
VTHIRILQVLQSPDCYTSFSVMPSSIAELFGVQGRVALITGGTSGVGMMIAQGLVSNGVKVYVTGLASDDIEKSVADLNDIGKESGGEAIG